MLLNLPLLEKKLVQLASITRRFGTAAFVGAALAAACAGSGEADSRSAAALPPPGEPVRWNSAPAYAELFAPRAQRPAYRFFTSPHPLAALLPQVSSDAASVRTPGGWTARALLPFDAFGQSGEYDRTKLARLYGARRAQVARGPRQDGGIVVESWTLVSPYPDTTLTALEPGTLLIVLRLP